MTDVEAVAPIKEKLLEMTTAFCRERLDKDYERLAVKLVNKLARKRPPPILRGRLENWAAGIIHALGSVNFLFDKSFEPYVASPEISEHFGVSPSTMSQKSKVIRDLFKMDHFGNQEFQTAHMKRGFAPVNEMIQQLAGMLADSEEPPDGEFVDQDHPVIDAYYGLCERYNAQRPSKSLQTALEKLIARDPDFFDPYLMLRDLLLRNGQTAEAATLLDEAYARALRRITAATGEWPEALAWGWLENRHLIRTLLNKALDLWDQGDLEAALDLLRRLLRSNPNDNIGARYYILGIRTGLTLEGFEARFNKGGYYDAELPEWFDTGMAEFPDEFDEWKKAAGHD